MPKSICNTSPIQYLHQLDLLHLLEALAGQITVPPAVGDELAVGHRLGISLPDVETLGVGDEHAGDVQLIVELAQPAPQLLADLGIESLILSSIIASFASCVVLEIGAKQLTEKEQWAISVQRIAHIVVLVAREFIHYLTTSSHKAAAALVEKITLLSREMFEKNHRHRLTSLGQLNNLLAC